MTYQPGLHIIAEFRSDEKSLLTDYVPVKEFFDKMINSLSLTRVGEIYHAFPGAGYTGTICFTESHIAFHTWPEYGYVTFDVFLSNFSRNNDDSTRKIFEDTIQFFSAFSVNHHEIRR
jgi:S-adenosylmethionine decarboxylase